MTVDRKLAWFGRASLFGLFIATLALAGCTSSEERSSQLTAKMNTAGAECIGHMITEFDTIQIAIVEMDCGSHRLMFVAWARSHASPYMICGFTWAPAVNRKGTGALSCDNGSGGTLAYDRTDPKNIPIEAKLDGGGSLDFILREDNVAPNKDHFPN